MTEPETQGTTSCILNLYQTIFDVNTKLGSGPNGTVLEGWCDTNSTKDMNQISCWAPAAVKVVAKWKLKSD